MADRSELSRCRGAATLACLIAAGALGAPAFAQGYSRAVVQPTPSPSLADLNSAMRDLARNKNNVPALLRAGWASLDIDDNQAALGFFTRAQALQPQNGEVKAGLATTALRNGSPVVAVRLFAEAEASGTPMARFASDRGLAMDLVGDNTSAQRFYRQALAAKPDDAEASRRLALSEAIAGDLTNSERTLLPLLQHRDLAAYRTRAFALAIAGKGEDAVSIAETMLPGQISNRMAPYLRYMPRLTRAQQAAAANLGQFPPAADIGRDEPTIAAMSSAATPQVASAAPDSRLVPAGKPLGGAARPAPARATQSRSGKSKSTNGGSVSVTYTPLAQASTPPAPAVPKVAAAVQQPAPAVQQLAERPTQAPAELPPQRVAAAVQAPPAAPPQEIPEARRPVLVAALAPDAVPAAQPPVEAPRPSFSISPPVSASEPPPRPESLAQAFADFAKPPAVDTRPEEAVDILQLAAAREASRADEAKARAAEAKAAEAKAKAAKAKAEADAKAKAEAKAKADAKAKAKANPQRFWAQVGTGRDLKALAFSWKRLQHDAGALLARRDSYSAKWGATRRLLAGPYKTEDEADKAVAALKKKGIDAFEFTSDEGEEVAPL